MDREMTLLVRCVAAKPQFEPQTALERRYTDRLADASCRGLLRVATECVRSGCSLARCEEVRQPVRIVVDELPRYETTADDGKAEPEDLS